MSEIPTAESIGQRLRRLRLERRLSQRELASPGVSYAYISRIEAGTRQPSVKALRMLARKLGVAAEYLETGSEIGADEQRELRLADAELELRLNDPARAEETFRALLDEAVAAGDLTASTRARMALGLIAANQGRHQAAVELLEDSLRSPNAPLPESRPDVFVTLGQSYAALGRLQLAVELFARCLADVEESPDSTPAQIRFSIYLSCALADMGEVERAQEVVTDALARSEGFADPIAHVHLNWSVARLASLRGQPGIALEYARRAIALLEASEDTLQLGRAHLLAAGIMNMQGEASRATPHLELAERLLGRRADAGDLASLRAEQAKTFAYVGDADAAIAHAQEALDLLGDDDPAEQGGVWTALARGLELKGETASAEEAFRRGMELLSGQGRWREAEQAARSWSRVLADAGRKDDAAELDERAEEFAARAGAAAEANAAH